MFTYLQHSDPTVPYYREVRHRRCDTRPHSRLSTQLRGTRIEFMDVRSGRASNRGPTRVRMDRAILLARRTFPILFCRLNLVPDVTIRKIAHDHVAHHFFVSIPFCGCLLYHALSLCTY